MLERLKEYNKVKQMASLGAAILFLTARSLGWTRTVVEICSCFEWGDDRDQQQQQQLIKPKHCSKAMKEIQASFPEYARAPTNSGPAQSNTRNSQDATANFAEHALRRLQLPPVAESSIRALLLHCREEQVKLGRNSGTKLSTLCASVTYFVCHAGSIMQRLAQQIPENQRPTTSTNTTTLSQSIATSSTLMGHKRALASDIPILRKKRKLIDPPTTRIIASIPTLGEINKVTGENQEAKARSNDSDDDDSSLDHLKPDDEEEPFDVFSHAPIMLDDEHCPEKQEYEMRRMWDAWREQMPWSRSISEIEQSCGVSRNSLNGFYKSELYPRRDILLAVLKDAVSMAKDHKKGGGVSLHPNNNNKEANSLQETPLAPILLMQVSTAAQLMSGK